MKVSITFAAVVALIPSALAHVVMDFPKPFAGGQDAMSPMDEAGTLFPCMAPNYDSLGSQLTIQPGESGVIELAKSFPGAPHGGGSCQISLTYDKAPTASSRFTVIKSIMGGCPVRTNLNDNTGPYSLSYTIPKDAPSGPAILAWTWFNQIGNREMYMRCSPITIGGSNTDTSSFSKRPEIFKANIGNGCKTEANKDVIFPNPGPDVEGSGNAPPTGENCGSSSSTPIEVPAVTPTLPTSSATPTESGILAPGGDKIKLPTTTTATSSVQAPVQTPIETPESPVEAPVETPAPTPIETPVEDEEPVVSNPVSPPVVAPETPVVSPPSGDAVPCSKPGAVVCTSDNTFALCNHGFLVPMGRTALGTFCANGVISRRSYPIRLTGHLRRRHGKF